MTASYRLWIGGAWRDGAQTQEVRNPYNDEVIAQFALAGEQEVEEALASSARAFPAMRAVPTYRRAELLLRLAETLRARREEFARSIVLEAGKPITDARFEVDRAINVLTLSGEEAKRIAGEVMPLDLMPTSVGRLGLTRRFPIGPIVGISPYNFPLNLGMHKIGPALAAGCTLIWKPSLLTPGAAFLFAAMFAELAETCDVPPAALSVLTPPDALAERLVTDARTRMLSFTGSAKVGWMLRAKAGDKRVTLELGGNAAALIAADADLDYAVQRCVAGGYGYAGQTCISVQRILVEETIYDAFLARFVSAVRALRVGDPRDEATQMGPMVSEREAARVAQWIQEAADGGAKIVTGGTRRGLLFAPAVLTHVRPEMKVSCAEAFGPLVTVTPFSTWEEALAVVNDSPYGLQAGIFTSSLNRAFQAFQTLEVGGLIVNDVPGYRMDSMPYGGVKESGLGREGVKYALEEMTEIRLMALNLRL
jgi:glyceraldehyde-3-phosphate dehydrogenase (NADP+)